MLKCKLKIRKVGQVVEEEEIEEIELGIFAYENNTNIRKDQAILISYTLKSAHPTAYPTAHPPARTSVGHRYSIYATPHPPDMNPQCSAPARPPDVHPY